jgi:AcrR family transcriptional regulator
MMSDAVQQRDRAQRRPRADGERTRGAILRAAASLATVDGLEGLSIGNLAAAIGMSKSGLYAHFGSKQELQLATVEAADRIFQEVVVQPALAAPPGLAQMVAVCEAFFDYLQRHTFPGGCFFATAALEMGTRPGPVKERVAALQAGFIALIRGFAATAVEQHELPAREDPDRLAFELHGIMLAADTSFVLHDDPAVLNLARQIVHQRLGLDNGGNTGESWARGPGPA